MAMIPIPLASLSSDAGLLIGEIGAVLLFLGLASFIAAKLKFSPVPIFLVAGLALGNGGLVPLSLSDSFLDLGAQIGAILLLLLLGLEYTAGELIGTLKERRSLGFFDLIVNFIPGAVIALFLGWGVVGVLVLGGITYVSSSGIATQFIKDAKWQKLESTKRAVAVLVVEDLFLAPYLPILSALTSGVALATGLISISAALVITGAVLIYSAKSGHIPHGPTLLGDSAALLLTVFGVALLASGLATFIGFSGAVAAFLVGLLLTGDLAIVARVRLAPLRDLFASIFFLFFGLSTNPADIIEVFIPALLLSILGVSSKYLTAWWSVRGVDEPRAVTRAAVLLISRGEFSLVIAGLAAATTFGESLGALTITYVILTTLFASLILRRECQREIIPHM
jgi:CPA2 family monovalent cation:H+ antiporter-2